MFWFFSGLAILLVLACAGFTPPFMAVVTLLLGWTVFLWRVLPHITLSASGAATGLIAFAFFVAGIHLAGRWFYRECTSGTSNAERGSDDAHWKLRWTGTAVIVVLLMFCAGIAVVGVAHQIAWLARSDERWIESDFGPRSAARRSQSKNNLKFIGVALHNYHDMYQALPAGGTFDPLGRPMHGWQSFILPFVDQLAIYKRIDFDLPWNDQTNRQAFATYMRVYTNPGIHPWTALDADGYAPSHYAGNSQMLSANSGWKSTEIVDGTANTILGGEVNANFKPWGHPLNFRDPAKGINQSPDGFGSPWKGDGCQFLFTDGSVQFLSENIDAKVLHALSTPAGGETVGEF
jgi:hypothetical protein